MSQNSLTAASLRRLTGRHVLVLGDVMLDEYMYGSADRISPEAPVPVVRLEKRVYSGGGAANAANNIACLGGTPHLVGVAGTDRYSDRLRRALSESGIADDGITLDSDRPTTVKTRVVAHGQQVLRIDQEAISPLGSEAEDRIIESALSLIPQVDAVVLCDYAKGVVTPRVCRIVLDACVAAGRPSVADPKGSAYERYQGVSLITPNLKEAQLAVAALLPGEDPNAWGSALLSMLPRSAVLITKGPAGMTLFRSASDPLDIPARARSVYDVTGAGDTVAATAALALGAGLPMQQAVWLANVAAGIVVRKVGTSTTNLDELADAVEQARRETSRSEPETTTPIREVPAHNKAP